MIKIDKDLEALLATDMDSENFLTDMRCDDPRYVRSIINFFGFIDDDLFHNIYMDCAKVKISHN
ncbi:MAG: hypothetical protein V4721_16455 [Bacteroidota bacterium]